MNRSAVLRSLYRASLVLIAFSVSLNACGSSGNGIIAGGGIGGTGKSVGTITAFGSVFLNDNEYITTDAAITVNGGDASEGDLEIGMKIILQALNGKAVTIEYEPELMGPVKTNSVNVPANTFTVLEQIVHVDTSTTYKNISGLAAINDTSGNEDIIQVSGFINADGSIRATFVALESPSLQDFEIKGTVSNLVPDISFTINNLIVQYSGSSDPISNDSFVEVEGEILGGNFIASEVELESEVPNGSEGEQFELEGTITEVTSLSNFKVNGQTVLTTAGTEYENGSSADIVLNRRVEIEGVVNSNSAIVASNVEFK